MSIPLPTNDLDALEVLHKELQHKMKCNEALLRAATVPSRRAKLKHKIALRQLQIRALSGAIHTERVLTRSC